MSKAVKTLQLIVFNHQSANLFNTFCDATGLTMLEERVNEEVQSVVTRCASDMDATSNPELPNAVIGTFSNLVFLRFFPLSLY